jgi:hypothetical protein
VPKRLAPFLALVAILILAGCSGPGSPGKPGPVKPNPSKTSATGCGLVPESQIAAIAGIALGHGVSSPLKAVTPTKQVPVLANQSCSYKASADVYLEYFINTLSTPAAAYETNVWQADVTEEPSSVIGSVDGLPCILMTEGDSGGGASSGFIQLVFYKGQEVVQINTDGMPLGTAQKVAGLIVPHL